MLEHVWAFGKWFLERENDPVLVQNTYFQQQKTMTRWSKGIVSIKEGCDVKLLFRGVNNDLLFSNTNLFRWAPSIESFPNAFKDGFWIRNLRGEVGGGGHKNHTKREALHQSKLRLHPILFYILLSVFIRHFRVRRIFLKFSKNLKNKNSSFFEKN